MSTDALKNLVALKPHSNIVENILAIPPYSLGFPSENTQSMYYPGEEQLTRDEIAGISRVLGQNGIYPENTRLTKSHNRTQIFYHVLQASSKPSLVRAFKYGSSEILLQPGDYAEQMSKISEELRRAQKYSANGTQRKFIEQYIKSFETGDLGVYRDSQRTWVRDLKPKVENILGFVEPYRDPFGVRAEFEGIVAISDSQETKALTRLVEQSDKFFRELPWASSSTENGGKGPLEKSFFEPPDLTGNHGKHTGEAIVVETLIFAALAYCSSIIFPGINLPNVHSDLSNVWVAVLTKIHVLVQ
jgi:dipeptidyl-peptidase III